MFSIKVSLFVLASSMIVSVISCGDCCAKETEYTFMEHSTYSTCEGKDSGNYTLVSQFTRDSRCSVGSNKLGSNAQLLQCSASSRQTSVNQLQVLASSVNPNGAQINIDILSLVTSGPLEGKYVYEREVVLEPQYLKICSSVLGYSYVNSKSNTLLIADKLDLNVLISPTGAFELFKKGCTTQCTGTAIILGPTAITSK